MSAALLLSIVLALTPTNEVAPARTTAAGILDAALARDASTPEADLVLLRSAAGAAIDSLGTQRIATLIERDVLEARWQAAVDVTAAAAQLREDLTRFASDLRFEPLMEAPQPPGFPEPTPIHEIRLTSYPSYRLAYADMAGSSDGSAFFKLFRHIQSNDIKMTAPVEVTFDAERMQQTRMAFLYEGPTQGQVGDAGQVEVVDIPAMEVLSIGARGNDSRQRIDTYHALLLEWIAGNPDYEVAGDMRTMGFNSPMVRGDRRFFEVQIPVRRVEIEAEPEAEPVIRQV